MIPTFRYALLMVENKMEPKMVDVFIIIYIFNLFYSTHILLILIIY